MDACHGHALVLFTSYRQMAEVRALTDGQWQYPTYQAWRNGGKIIQKFKQSGNGVLFAAGSCWEGIDFPGDMVSLLIIAKLPFPIPDPVSDYERQQYPNLRDYINAEVIPEMQKKLRQGFGRAIRTEQDSCVVAILDERAGIGGKYHDAALAALPDLPNHRAKLKMCSNSFGSRSARITFCEKRNLRCTLCETTDVVDLCALRQQRSGALPLTGCMTLSTKPPDTVFLCAAHLLTIAAETP